VGQPALATAHSSSASAVALIVAGSSGFAGVPSRDKHAAVRRLPEERLRDVVPLGRHELQLGGRLGKRHGDDVVPAERGHLPELAGEREIGRLEAEARRQHAVAGRGAAAALDVAEHRDAGLEARPLLDLASERLADAARASAPVGRLSPLSYVSS